MSDTVPQEFWQGVEEFNRQEYYACHDTLEALWMDSTEPDKTFYQGVLQIAVALYHLNNYNWRGSAILLGEGINRLRYYQPIYAEIDVESLIEESADLLNAVQQNGAEKLAEFVEQLNTNSHPNLLLPKIVKISDF